MDSAARLLVDAAAREGALLRARAGVHEAEELVPMDVYRQLAASGLMAVHTRPELGGAGGSVLEYAESMMAVAAGCASTAVTMAVTNMVGEVLAAFAQPALAAHYCTQLAAGGLGAFALSETNAGSDPAGMRTTARPESREGEAGFRLDGDKQWISHGDRAAVLVVWAQTERGISCFAVPGADPGVAVARKEDKMGLRASATCALTLEDVWVPASALLGEEGRGFRVAMMALDGGRIGIASQAVGIAERAYEILLASMRAQSGQGGQGAQGGEPPQDAQFRLADARTRLDAARQLIFAAARLKQQGVDFTRAASMAKLFATESAQFVCDVAVDVVPPTHPEREAVERCYRDVRVTRIYEGTSEIQRHVIARQVMKSA